MTLQYYKPAAPGVFVGDCMPFSHGGVFRLYYLWDEGHHSALGGLGGHQWAQASSTDLRHWQHHPLAIAVDDADEGSICTGSVLCHQGTYYGFYATRRRNRTQHLGLAISSDGVHFRKTQPNPLASPPPGYCPFDFRDPVAFRDPADGRFHLLVTACLADGPVPGRGGCLAHLISADLRQWRQADPFLVPGPPPAGAHLRPARRPGGGRRPLRPPERPRGPGGRRRSRAAPARPASPARGSSGSTDRGARASLQHSTQPPHTQIVCPVT